MKKDSTAIKRGVLFGLRPLNGNGSKQFLLCLYWDGGDGICAVQKDCFLKRIQVRGAVPALFDMGLDLSAFLRVQVSVQIIANMSIDGFAARCTAMCFLHIMVSYNH